jgi:hypothetical protein
MHTGYKEALPFVGIEAGRLMPLDNKVKIYLETGYRRRLLSYYEGISSEVGFSQFNLSGDARWYLFDDNAGEAKRTLYMVHLKVGSVSLRKLLMTGKP